MRCTTGPLAGRWGLSRQFTERVLSHARWRSGNWVCERDRAIEFSVGRFGVRWLDTAFLAVAQPIKLRKSDESGVEPPHSKRGQAENSRAVRANGRRTASQQGGNEDDSSGNRPLNGRRCAVRWGGRRARGTSFADST